MRVRVSSRGTIHRVKLRLAQQLPRSYGSGPCVPVALILA